MGSKSKGVISDGISKDVREERRKIKYKKVKMFGCLLVVSGNI